MCRLLTHTFLVFSLHLVPFQAPSPPDLSAVKTTSLCDLFAADTGTHQLQDDDQRNGHIFLLQHSSLDKAKIMHMIPIQSLHLPENHQKLSLKERCGLAAYAAMSVLHLGNGPWLSNDWVRRQVGIFLERRENDGDKFAERLCFLYASMDPATPLWTCLDGGGCDPIHQNPDENLLVPNVIVFALGILLVELCLGKACTQLEEREQQQHKVITDRYAMAVRRLDEVYALVGSSYGDAAKKCIKFCFPGKDTHNTFEMEKFRATFYRQVVAPVQATYSRFLN